MTSRKNTKAYIDTEKEVLLWGMVIEGRNWILSELVFVLQTPVISFTAIKLFIKKYKPQHPYINNIGGISGEKGGTHLWRRRKRKNSNFRGIAEWS
jgi:hypothetical protein